jgi:membrane protein
LLVALKVLRDTWIGWQDDQAARHGAALAFYALFALAPLLLVATAVAGAVFGPESASERLNAQLRVLLTPEVAEALSGLVQNAYEGSGFAAGTLGALTSLYAGGRGFFHLQATLNHMWGVRVVRQQGLGPTIQRHFVAFASVMLCGILLLASIVGTMIVGMMADLAPLPRNWVMLRATQEITTFLLVWILLAVIYKTLPDAWIRWQDVAIGAAVTGVLFLIGKEAVALYVHEIGLRSSFGAAGALVIILVFSYYAAQVLLFGAELTYQIARHRGVPVKPRQGASRVVRTPVAD